MLFTQSGSATSNPPSRGLGTDTVLWGNPWGLGPAELLGRSVPQMSHILDYLSLLEREREKTGSLCHAPTPTPPRKLQSDYFCVAFFYPSGCK